MDCSYNRRVRVLVFVSGEKNPSPGISWAPNRDPPPAAWHPKAHTRCVLAATGRRYLWHPHALLRAPRGRDRCLVGGIKIHINRSRCFSVKDASDPPLAVRAAWRAESGAPGYVYIVLSWRFRSRRSLQTREENCRKKINIFLFFSRPPRLHILRQAPSPNGRTLFSSSW